jgi:hypothetical protein
VVVGLLPKFIRAHYEVHEWKHACAVLKNDFPNEWKDIIEVLTAFRLRRGDAAAPGGGKSPVAATLDHAFLERGWVEKPFDTRVVVDKVEHENPTHRIDCYKNRVALEVEWNEPLANRSLSQRLDRRPTNG